MKAKEFIQNMPAVGETHDTLNEIITIDELVQPSTDHKQKISDLADTLIEGYTDLYWGMYMSSQFVVAKKQNQRLLAYTIVEKMQNNKSKEFPVYFCPKNLYSWANDKGITALELIKAVIRLASENRTPVMSDVELSPSAKKFLQRSVESGVLTGKIFNLSTGDVSPYDPDIWNNDDEYRILFMEHAGTGYPRGLIIEGTWNYRQLKKSNKLFHKYLHENTRH